MERARQFTLSYLFWEIFWIAAALACFTQLPGVPNGLQVALRILGTLFVCAAVGGLFGRMTTGFWVGVAVAVSIGALLAPQYLLLWLSA